MGNLFRKYSVPSFDQSITRLNFKLFRVLDKNMNLCVSSLALHQLLSVLFAMTMDTRAQRRLAEILDISYSSEAIEHVKNSWYNFNINGTTHNGPLKIRLGFFTKESVSEDMQMLIEKDFLGQIITVDRDDDLIESVEKFFRKYTKKSALSTLHAGLMESDTEVILISMVQFTTEFDPMLKWVTVPNCLFFTGYNGIAQTDMLFDFNQLPYFHDRIHSVQVLKIPCDPSYYLLFVLPDDDLKMLETTLIQRPELLQAWMKRVKSTSVAVYLPKFTFKDEINISNLFKLKELKPSWGLPRLDLLKQNDDIIHSGGTEPEGHFTEYLVDNIVRKSTSPVFKANKPCLYFLYHNELLLCMGRIVNPTIEPPVSFTLHETLV